VRELEHLAHVQEGELARLKALLGAGADHATDAGTRATAGGAAPLVPPALQDSSRELARALRRRIGDARRTWSDPVFDAEIDAR
jgi:hypothetical protein